MPDNKDTWLQVRINDSVKQMLFDLAAEAGVSASQWVREAIIKAWTLRQVELSKNPAEQD